jgi:hypothetical protein
MIFDKRGQSGRGILLKQCCQVVRLIATRVNKLKMSKELWWDVTDRGKRIFSGKNLSQCHFVKIMAYNSHKMGVFPIYVK